MISIGVDLASAVAQRLGLTGSQRPEPPPSEPGPKLMHLGSGRIPQGQAFEPERGQVFTTFNKDDQVLVSVQDADVVQGEVAAVVLGGYAMSTDALDQVHPADRGLYARAPDNGPPSKGGGIAIHGDFVYVADTQGVYTYALEDIRNADTGANEFPVVPAIGYQKTDHFNNASFITIHDGHAYVGQFSVEEGGIGDSDGDGGFPTSGSLTRFEIAADGSFINPTGPIEAPAYAQGVAVTEQGLFYTTSYGSNTDDSPHALVYQPFEDFDAFTVAPGSADSAVQVMELDYYAEEFNIVDGEIWVTYESNAGDYPGNYEGNVGQAPDNQSIRRYSLDDLDLSRTNITRAQAEAAFGG